MFLWSDREVTWRQYHKHNITVYFDSQHWFHVNGISFHIAFQSCFYDLQPMPCRLSENDLQTKTINVHHSLIWKMMPVLNKGACSEWGCLFWNSTILPKIQFSTLYLGKQLLIFKLLSWQNLKKRVTMANGHKVISQFQHFQRRFMKCFHIDSKKLQERKLPLTSPWLNRSLSWILKCC